MKYLILVLFGLTLCFFGCTDNNVVQPDLDDNYIEGPSLKKDKKKDNDTPTLPDDPTVSVKYSKTLTINGKRGGKVKLSYQWKEGPNAGTKFEADLKFQKRSFEGVKTFDMVFDPEKRFIEIYPSPFALDKPALLTLKFKGIDVSGYDPSCTEFVYESPSGEIIPTPYEELIISIERGELFVIDASLDHFSRFGFVR